MLLLWKINVAKLLLAVSQLWCTLLSCLAFLLVLPLTFPLVLVLSSQECGLKGYQPTLFMMKNEKHWGDFFKQGKPEKKERYDGHYHYVGKCFFEDNWWNY